MKKQEADAKKKFLKAVGGALHKRRIQLGLSQETLAYEANVDRSYLSEAERGERNISIFAMKKITEALDTTILEVFKNVK